MKVTPAAYDKSVAKKLVNKVIKKAISQNLVKGPRCRKCGEQFISRWYRLKHKCRVVEMEKIEINQSKETETAKLEPKKDLKCPKCIGIYFPSEEALKHHKILHSGYKAYTCNVCTVTFESEAKWRSHIEQSSKLSHCDECLQYFGCLIVKQRHVCLDSSYYCTYCGAQFKKSLALERHKEKCKLMLNCHICGRKFVKRTAFKVHMKQIHGVTLSQDFATSTPLPAKEAPNIFTTIDKFIKQGQEKQDTSLKIESETILLNGPVSSLVMCSVIPTPNGNNSSTPLINRNQCEVCHKTFRNPRAKVVHKRVHSSAAFGRLGNNTVSNDLENVVNENSTVAFVSVCETCEKATNFNRETDKECKVCQGSPCTCEKPSEKFVCSLCSGEYKKEVNESLICKECREIFEDQTIFDEHLKSHDVSEPMNTNETRPSPVQRVFKCPKCKSGLKTLTALKSHKKICVAAKAEKVRGGGQKICCLQCEKVLGSNVALESHLKTCGKEVAEGEDLEGNNELKRLKSTLNESALLNASGSTSVECNKCMKIFRTPKHLEMHDKQVHRDYQCKVCNLMFWKSEDLLNHFRVHNNARMYKCDHCDETVDSSMKFRFHRVTHFCVPQPEDEKDVPISVYQCLHCHGEFDTFRKFELHCKRLAIGADGKIKVLPKKVRSRTVIKKLRNDVFAGLHVAVCLKCQQTFEDEESLKAHKANCSALRASTENDDVSTTTGQDEMENSNMESGCETPPHGTPSNYQTSPSIFGEMQFEEDEDEEEGDGGGGGDVEMEAQWDLLNNKDEEESVFESTIDFIESARRDEPITCDSNLVFQTVKAMDICIRSRGARRATTRMRKIIKDVFRLLVDHPVTIERPHTCYVCGKLFIHPQGITNHYYQKHGAKGILHSLALVKENNKDLPEKLEKKPKRRQRKLDKSLMEDDEDFVVDCKQVENNVSPKDEPVLLELRNNISKLLCHLVSDNDVLAELGWPKRLIDDVLIDVINRCESRPCLDARKSRLSRLRENITTLLSICVKEQAMVNFGWNSKPVDEVVREMLAGGEIAST